MNLKLAGQLTNRLTAAKRLQRNLKLPGRCVAPPFLDKKLPLHRLGDPLHNTPLLVVQFLGPASDRYRSSLRPKGGRGLEDGEDAGIRGSD